MDNKQPVDDISHAVSKRHSEEILNLIKQISDKIQIGMSAEELRQALQLFGKLSGKLRYYLQFEDMTKYQVLAQDINAEVQNKANEFVKELQRLFEQLQEYKDKWLNSNTIVENINSFMAETQQFFSSVEKNIHKKEREIRNFFTGSKK